MKTGIHLTPMAKQRLELVKKPPRNFAILAPSK